ncbi:MAG: TonB-dependent copper receptor [Saccharospirillaceae bacterium]|nr:TonB-dependent copper receptor [Saccharospirillaceae bacterium]MCD8532873.1 TonB-dependent copper receptor [Saccharospirillaceae bacterium]
MRAFRPSLLSVLITSLSVQNALASGAGTAEAITQLEPMVITAPPMSGVLTVSTDPKAPRQPVPAHDGADLLKNIPGFSVIRKGGTDGDPVFRGMAASRLGVLLDGEMILGGCGMRMDPPTAYVFPEAYDEVTVLKGPQTVKYGPGNSAGVVMFERAAPDFSTTPVQGDVSLLAGSTDRNDQVAHLLAGGQKGYIDVSGTRSDANNYEDGDGNEVHSAYTRWSTHAALGWTPDNDTRIELSGAKSDGEARYGDRGMDGVKFARSNLGLSYEQDNISPLLNNVKARIYRNYVDHVMDNYSLRANSGMNMVSNPDRETKGASLSSTLALSDSTELEIGVDSQRNEHALRKASSMMTTPDYDSLSRVDDMRFASHGMYAELDHRYTAGHSVHAGVRMNKDKAEDLRINKTTSGMDDNNTLRNGFIRYEHQLNSANRLYAGLGRSERAADYWERSKNPAATSTMMTGMASTFDIAPEKTTQLDIGALHNSTDVQASVSAFYTRHKDYILIETLPDVSAFASNARNIDATSYGAEADSRWEFTPGWNSTATLAWVHGENDSDHRALGQMPPLEARVGLNYDNGLWSAGALWRLVDEQNRVAEGSGNIVGQDIGKSGGFNVFSLNAGYRPMDDMLLTAGIDNLFDVTYAEHISRSGAAIPGYESTTRINEPGRTLWLKMQWAFQ